MTFAEAMAELLNPPDVAIQAASWRSHPCDRMLVKAGSDGIYMLYYDFVQGRWFRTWTVFFPLPDELKEEWVVIPETDVQQIRELAGGVEQDGRKMEEIINYHARDNDFLRRYAEIGCPYCGRP